MICFEIGVKALQLYVFDDTDPDETTYLGVAKLPLITLAHDKPIHGTFELIKVFSNVPFCLSVLSIDFSFQFTFLFLYTVSQKIWGTHIVLHYSHKNQAS